MKSFVAMTLGLALCAACSSEPQRGHPILAAFVRDDCPPCMLMEPWLKRLKGQAGQRFELAVVNFDEPGGAQLAAYFGLIAIPSQVYIDASGNVAAIHSGIASLEDMEARLAPLLEGGGTH